MAVSRSKGASNRLPRAGAIVLGLVALASIAAPTPVGAAPTPPAAAVTGSWLVYHHDPAGQGVAGPINLSRVHRVWTSPALDGQLYGEPLVDGPTVLVATENDTVYALNALTGKVRWSTHLGTPVDSSQLPCGNISPSVGITSTPVIDPFRQEVFVVADVEGRRGPVHQLVGLTMATGTVVLRQGVDPPGIFTPAALQRVALTLDAGRVVFGFGGNFGDCSTYHGWVVSVPEGGGKLDTYEVDSGPGQSEGAVWMGGAAPVIDQQGNIWVAVGNGSHTTSADPYDGSDSVLELSASLKLLQYFAPTSWASDNAHDFDLGSSAPVLLPNGLVVQAGKSQTAYLLSERHLGGIGRQLATLPSFCGDDVDGGSAVVGTTVYVPCRSGTIALVVGTSPPSLTIRWQAAGVSGPPIVAGGFVWAIDGNGSLDALNESTGAVVHRFSLGTPANHFPTPSVGAGRLFGTGDDRVFAFAG